MDYEQDQKYIEKESSIVNGNIIILNIISGGKMPKYSLIVPVYNVEKYISACINSILNQTFDDYEVIIVDDGSTDCSLKAIEEIAENNKEKIKVIHQENQGLGEARNTGLRHANGEYIWFIDSDDTIDVSALRQIDEKIQKEDLDIVIFDMIDVDEKGEKLGVELGVSFEHQEMFSLSDNSQLLFMSPSACNKVFKREIFKNSNIFFPRRVWFEDLYTIPKIYLQASRIAYINKGLYLYLQRKGSIMKNTNVEKNSDIISALDEIISYYKARNKYEEYKMEIAYLAIINVYLLASVRVIMGNRKSGLLKKIKIYMKEEFGDYRKNEYYFLLPRKYKLTLHLLDNELYGLVEMLFWIKGRFKTNRR